MTFGNGGNGRLGHGDTNSQLRPTIVQALLATKNHNDHSGVICVRAVSCGGTHTACAMSDGKLWSCGDGRDGQLGLGQSLMGDVLTPRPVNFSHTNVTAFAAAAGDANAIARADEGCTITVHQQGATILRDTTYDIVTDK